MSDVTPREKASAIVFALVATAILVEVGFRAIGPTDQSFNNMRSEYPDNPRDYFDLLESDEDGKIYGVRMNAAQGLGGRLPEAGEAQGPFRILGLGDSQAQGQGVRFDDTMYAKLGSKLQQAGQNIAVKNVAVSGYDLNEIVSRYAYEARDSGRHDWVIYAMVLDDFGLDRGQLQGQNLIQDPPRRTDDPWRSRSSTYNFAIQIAEQWNLSQNTTAAYLDSYRGESLQKNEAQLRELAQAVKTDGARFLIVVLPLLYDFEHYPFGEIHSTMLEWGRDNDVAVIDGFDVLKRYKASDLWVHASDHHPNEVAHDAIAQAIFERISTSSK